MMAVEAFGVLSAPWSLDVMINIASRRAFGLLYIKSTNLSAASWAFVFMTVNVILVG
jgi:hypothetical protein